MIRSLVTFHFDEQGRNSGAIDEPEIPVLVLVDAGPEVARRRHLVNNLVLSVSDIDHQRHLVETSLGFQLVAGLDWRRRLRAFCLVR